MNNEKILDQNSKSWDIIAYDWFGVTALPTYGPFTPKEDELNLFEDVSGKYVLDIGCGSGHSLCYMGEKGASELWGIDISSTQIKSAKDVLNKSGYSQKLFVSPMENNPGIPLNYFDIVYSIYALGWTIDLEKTINMVSNYLKPGGIFVFSWDNPLMQCLEAKDDKIFFNRSYMEEELINMKKGGQQMSLYNWKLSTYINALSNAGMKVERLIEKTDTETLNHAANFSEKYYSAFKAKIIPMSFIIKAIKL
ncbi:class I SAM-dependent methyltransferase [Clostridium estertheticum]|uniref:class I SAM-dependent methyltransferase n=1 Tax=Clostridium estertheticum TaxID=238834 RepID=UPI001C0C5B7A|nr:class I SAM-dependent methyltransferase [Clostridium estertheticum]MBU3183635.1 class I SAM-dependent methyltransferase [Clostridium estertheticum]